VTRRRRWVRSGVVSTIGALLVIVAVPTALDGMDQVVAPVGSAPTVSQVAAAARSCAPVAAALSRVRRLGGSSARAPITNLRRIASGGQVRRPVRPDARATLVTLVAVGVLTIRRRRRLKDPVPPRQRGPDGSRAPPPASSTCRAIAAALALGRSAGRVQGGTSCPSSNNLLSITV
jgi:hypothetical protein